MISRGGVTWLGLALVAAVAAFTLNHETRDLRNELARLEQDLEESRETVRVLHAEWSYLSRPERLEDLALRHLDLAPMAAGQIVELADVPLRMPNPPAAGLAALPGSSRISFEPGQP